MLAIDTIKNLPDLSELKSLGETALHLTGKSGDFSLSLSFVPPGKIKRLNKKFRNLDSETDVLSFPMLNIKPERAVEPLKADDWPSDLDENGRVFLGDIVICPDAVKRQALELGHSEARETQYLFAHAILHLLGFDHMNETDKEAMRKVERQIFDSAQCLNGVKLL